MVYLVATLNEIVVSFDYIIVTGHRDHFKRHEITFEKFLIKSPVIRKATKHHTDEINTVRILRAERASTVGAAKISTEHVRPAACRLI